MGTPSWAICHDLRIGNLKKVPWQLPLVPNDLKDFRKQRLVRWWEAIACKFLGQDPPGLLALKRGGFTFQMPA
jgi:hypothetical protein